MGDFESIPYERLEGTESLNHSPAVSAFVVRQERAPAQTATACHQRHGPESLASYEVHKPSPTGPRKTLPNSKSGLPRESRARQQNWMVVYKDGQTGSFRADKRGIIQKFRLGIPIRDMRLLDPALLTSETGKLLVRDNAIVFSMEHVRLIITADEVIYPELTHNSLACHFTAHLAIALKEASEQAQQMEILHEELSQTSDGSRHEVAALPFELQVLEVALRDVSELATRLF
eukprot:jgi/Botrbrau1/18221/Bobra.53_1s0078.1